MFEDTEDTFPHCLSPQKTNHCLTGLDQYIFSTSLSNLINPNQPTGSAYPCVRISWKFFSNQLLLLFCLIHPDFISVWCCCCCCCNICRRITIINPAFQTLLVGLTKRAIHRDEFFLCSALYRQPWRLQRWWGACSALREFIDEVIRVTEKQGNHWNECCERGRNRVLSRDPRLPPLKQVGGNMDI